MTKNKKEFVTLTLTQQQAVMLESELVYLIEVSLDEHETQEWANILNKLQSNPQPAQGGGQRGGR